MHTNQQKYAQKAFGQAEEIAKKYEKGSEYRQKYGSMSHKLPLLIRTAGLAQALAFVQAKKQTAYDDLLDHVATAVDIKNGKTLAQKSRREHVDGYILLTRRVTAALIWYKRFAESILDVKVTDHVPEEDEQ